MSTVYTIQGPGKAKKLSRRRARAISSSTCTVGDTKRVRAGGKKGSCTQEIVCTGKGPTGWKIVKGTRRCR